LPDDFNECNIIEMKITEKGTKRKEFQVSLGIELNALLK
jgi:hypothetical protein